MDILHLIDRLEALLNEGRHLPLTKGVVVDEQRAWDVIDQMRIAIPEEIKKAKRVNQERDRIIAQAHEEAGRIIDLAREEASGLISDHELTRNAQTRAETIVERARRDAEVIKADADDYVMQVLGELDINLTKTLSVVRNGLAKLQAERQALAMKTSAEEADSASEANAP
ncbi:MAG TPA: ATPase [Anaerolineae bacterium]|nr:ATPase [Anaerolineae bacterium]